MYIRLKDIGPMFAISSRYAVTLVSEFDKEVHEGTRYRASDLIRTPGCTIIDLDAFRDFLVYRKRLQGKTTRRFVPEFKR